MIAKLLKDFEDGKMTRRQLVQSLALIAAGATSASAQTSAPTNSPTRKAPWKTVWLDHISYGVSDYKRSTEFYTGLMGWEVENDNGTSQATLRIGNIGGIIIRNNRQGRGSSAQEPVSSPSPAVTSSSQSSAQSQSGRPPVTGVINHISWGIEPWDTQAVEAELKRRGLNPRPDHVGDTFRSFHVLDPDEWDLQISNKTKNA